MAEEFDFGCTAVTGEELGTVVTPPTPPLPSINKITAITRSYGV